MFRGPLAALSNFHAHPFHVPMFDRVVDTAEHAFNAAKTTNRDQVDRVLAARTPGEAKRLGRRVPLRPGWDTGVRVSAMRHILTAKFADPQLRQVLVGTGDLHLVENNDWHDDFWGSCQCPRHAATPGVNMLGELLMELRFTLRR